MEQEIIKIEGVTKRFPGVLALDSVDFSLLKGEIHSLMGENGAGKSTLIKVLTGVYTPESGNMYYAGKKFLAHSPEEVRQQGISTVYQEVNLIPTLSVAENIYIGRAPRKGGMINWKMMYEKAEAALSDLDIHIDPRKSLAVCSTAVQQMVSIARALDGESKVLILDEPTSSLDIPEVERLFAVMRKLKERDLGIIFVSHFLDQIFSITDRVTILRNGKLVGVHETSKLKKIELISMMLGREGDKNLDLNSKEWADYFGKPKISEQEPVIKVQGLTRGNSVSGVNLEFRPGEVVGFAGLLGSGRTETARLLFGVDRPDSGIFEIDGKKGVFASPRAAILNGLGFCPEDRKALGIMEDLSVRENIIIALQAKQGMFNTLSRKKMDEIAEHYITTLNIKTPSLNQKIKNLSGGNQQKVIVARWLAADPRFLILDEPTRGVDVGAKLEIQKLIIHLAEKGMSVLFISSELSEIVRCCSRVSIFRDHHKLAEFSGGEINESKIMETIAGGIK